MNIKSDAETNIITQKCKRKLPYKRYLRESDLEMKGWLNHTNIQNPLEECTLEREMEEN